MNDGWVTQALIDKLTETIASGRAHDATSNAIACIVVSEIIAASPNPPVGGGGTIALEDLPERTRKLLERTEEEWDAIQDATVTVMGLRAGHVLTEADAAAIALYDTTHRDDDENGVAAYHQGLEDGRAEAGGTDIATALAKVSDERAATAAARAIGRFNELRAFRLGAQACREMMARFVEQGGNPVIANSIRLNWHPGWGDDPGAPKEVAAP